MSLNTLETIRYEKNGEILNGVSSPNPVSSKERVVKLWAEILPNEDHSAVLHYLIVDENGVERTEEISVTALEDLIASLDATKVDIDAFRIDLGIKDLISNNTFNLTSSQIESISQKTTSIIEVTDNVTGRHRYFARTSYEPTDGIVTFCEVVDMGTKKAPSINEIEVSVGTSTAQYMEMGLQSRLSDTDLGNIAYINQVRIDLPTKASKDEVNSLSMCPSDTIENNVIPDDWNGNKYNYIAPSNGYLMIYLFNRINSRVNLYVTQKGIDIAFVIMESKGYGSTIIPMKKGLTYTISVSGKENVQIRESSFVYAKEI